MKQLEVLQSQLLPLKKLKPNTGQIPGLPANPRRITDIQLARLKRSIQQNPEMLALKELWVYNYKGEYYVIDGNHRLQALSGMQFKKVPCKVIPSSATSAQLRAYLIKANMEFGEWVDDMLSRDWDMQELDDFGMDDVDRLDDVVDAQMKEAEERKVQQEAAQSDVQQQISPDNQTPADNAVSPAIVGDATNVVMTYRVEVTCEDEVQQEELFYAFKERGLKCRILTL